MKKEIKTNKMKGFKATDEDLKCRDFQYEIGKEYEEEKAILCSRGFHFCENPLDVLNYYDLTNSRFFEVEADEVAEQPEDVEDTKRVSKKIKLTAELGLKGLINASFKYIKEQCDVKDIGKDNIVDDNKYSKVATSGDGSKVATSGDGSKVATSGYGSQVATSGDGSQVATSGDGSKVALNGTNSIGMIAGYDGEIKGKKGDWITLAEWKYDFNKGKYIPVCVKSAQIDGEILKEDTYYTLKNGEFEEC